MRLTCLLLAACCWITVRGSKNKMVDIACKQNPTLSYCRPKDDSDSSESTFRRRDDSSESSIRRSEPVAIFNKFDEKFEPRTSEGLKEGFVEQESVELLDSVEETTSVRPMRIRSTTPLPRRNMLYTVYPLLQKDHNPNHYCPLNQYTFQVTCSPGKKLRYDLQVFCQEFADTCGVPNTLLYPSRTNRGPGGEDEGRPKGYGQKQKNGNLGVGNSFAFGLGVLPGFEVVSSQGADIGHESLPGLNQIGGIMLNNGVEIGATGKRIGKGPARTIDALDRGFPSIGGLLGQGNPTAADKRATGEFLRSFGIPNVAGVGKILNALNGPQKKQRGPSRPFGYEPGYGALNKKAPMAIGKVDHDAVNLPAGLGDFEINKGGGFGIGK